MENLEYIQQPTQEKNEYKEKIIRDISELQKQELEKAQLLTDRDKNIPNHIEEFLVVDPNQLSKIDIDAFEKFQEFLDKKSSINSLKELDFLMDFFNLYKLKYENVSRDKITLARDMSAQGKSAQEIQTKLNEIVDKSDISKNSKFFMNYIVNRVNGENILLMDKLMNTEMEHTDITLQNSAP